MLASIFTFVSCDKTEVREPGTPPEATIEGVVYAALDLSNTDREFAPEGTKLFFRIDAKELMLAPGEGTYETLLYTTTVGANGKYSIKLPSANHKSVPVKITSDEFRVNQVQVGGEDEMVEFNLAEVTVNTQGEQKYVQDLTFAF